MHMNLCCSFHRQLINVLLLQMNFLQDPKLVSTTVLVVLIEYSCGLKNQEKECATVGVNSGKFYYGRKGKHGLNIQAVCDAQRWFTFVSIQHPASVSDYLPFATSIPHTRLTESSPLLERFCLYGDNAYINKLFMAVPFPNQGKGPKMTTTIFTQISINIECAFGIFTNRWALLKSPLSSKLPNKKFQL